MNNSTYSILSPNSLSNLGSKPLSSPSIQKLYNKTEDLISNTPSKYSLSSNESNSYSNNYSPETPITSSKIPFSRSATSRKHYSDLTSTPISPPTNFSPLLSTRKQYKTNNLGMDDGGKIILSQDNQSITVVTHDNDNYILTNKPIVSFKGVPIGFPVTETLTLRNNRNCDTRIALELYTEDPNVNEDDGFKLLLGSNVMELKPYADSIINIQFLPRRNVLYYIIIESI